VGAPVLRVGAATSCGAPRRARPSATPTRLATGAASGAIIVVWNELLGLAGIARLDDEKKYWVRIGARAEKNIGARGRPPARGLPAGTGYPRARGPGRIDARAAAGGGARPRAGGAGRRGRGR